jgi:murein L,D-transpeptidase YafK
MLASRRSFALTLATAVAAGLFATSCAPTRDPSAGASVPVTTRLVVHKREHLMRAYRGDTVLREFKVALGRGGLAPKVQQGDGRVPEGAYAINGRNPNSAYHLSLRISYPTPQQVRAAAARGIDPGGDIFIHGLPNGRGGIGESHRRFDWTEGCIAVTNPEIQWLWRSVPDGTPILILP